MVFSYYICQDCPDTGRITVINIYIYIFYQGGPIDHCTHVPGPFSQSTVESDYNASCTAGMDPAHFRMLKTYLLNKYVYVAPEQATPIILDIKSDIFMAYNRNDTKHTIHIYIKMNLVRNGEE